MYNLIKSLKLGLTNKEIEEILDNEGLLCDGFIDLFKFSNIIFSDDYNFDINKRNMDKKLSHIKDLMSQYYTSPIIAFNLNIKNATEKFLTFDLFKHLMYQIYQKEKKEMPSFPLLKSLFDYIDYKKDGIITIDEWTNIFGNIDGYLNLNNNNEANSIIKHNNKNIDLKKWENSQEIIKIFKIISRSRKLIKEKF